MHKINHHRLINILAVVVLVVSVMVGVFMNKYIQNLRTEAQVDTGSAFEIKDAAGNTINCSGTSCPTDEDTVTIRIKDLTTLEDLH